ncbi:peptidoglycan DD-metalloendopeptidase family protein [Paraburkholderia dilworthii]|uniref:peptidoglycan DD-metalloendopeptidase family protein n=1 Tax=Paraburkholderia dilworthii TaxID=948106 RepID=UPI000409A9AC|nr:peptidoglycan DD-metalloendopeptidase family protein [Paraburkholderia dilworthii]
MIISPPFLLAVHPQQTDTMATADAGNTVVPNGDVCAGNMLECAPGNGAYPVSFNLGWHGGAHLKAPLDGNQATSVRAIADGTIVYVRQTDATHKPTLQYRNVRTDDGCVVIRHDTEIGEGANAKVTYYSVYMHLQAVISSLSVGKKVYRKDLVGTPGQIYGQFPQIHFEIVCDEVNLKKFIGRAPGPLGSTPARADAVYGDSWFFIPCGAKLFTNEPHPLRDDDSAPPVGTLHPQACLVPAGTGRDLVIRMRYDRDCTLTTYQQDPDGSWSVLGAVPPEADAEYSLYKRATDLNRRYTESSLASVAANVVVPSPSAIFEMIRFGRCINDQLASGARFNHWRRVKTPDGDGWINLSRAGVRVYSDADFPEWAGWSFIGDDPTPDSLCDSPTVKRWLDVNQSGHVSHADAVGALGVDAVRQRLAHAVCKFPSEWSRSGLEARYNWLKSPHEALSNSLSETDFSALMDHARDLAFWEDIGDPDLPHSNECWHWPPREFTRHLRQCRWLSSEELEQVYPNTYVQKSGGHLHQAANTVSSEIRQRYKFALNRLMQKHSVTNNPMRMSHFLGQGAEESRTLAWMDEHRSEASCNSAYAHSNGNDLPGDGYKFRGRGMKQLTGKYNYTEYWVYRGWLDRRDFTASWWGHSHPTRPNITTPDVLLTVAYNTIDTGTWYWEAAPNHGLPHARSTVNVLMPG